MNTQIKDLQTLKDNNIDVNTIKFLYKRTSTGAIQIWGQELYASGYRSIIGQLEGKLQVSDWTTVKPKNLGKKNERLADDQAKFEVDNTYTKKLKQGYFESIEDIDSSSLIKPMLAYDWKDYKDKLAKQKPQKVFISSKMDGGRCLAKRQGLFTRTGEVIKSCDHISETLIPFFNVNPDVVLDGELYNHDDIGFDDIMSIFRRGYNTDEVLNTKYNRTVSKPDRLVERLDSKLLNFHVFDYISDDLFEDRYSQLILWFVNLSLEAPLYLVDQTSTISDNFTYIDNLYRTYLQNQYEGQMIKFNTPYINKRTKYLLKRKEWIDFEYTLVDMLEGEGNWSGKARIAVFDGFNADIVGTYEQCAEWLKNKDKYIGKPTTIKYFELTEDGAPRFGKVKELDRKI
jgi:DNA ligase 1